MKEKRFKELFELSYDHYWVCVELIIILKLNLDMLYLKRTKNIIFIYSDIGKHLFQFDFRNWKEVYYNQHFFFTVCILYLWFSKSQARTKQQPFMFYAYSIIRFINTIYLLYIKLSICIVEFALSYFIRTFKTIITLLHKLHLNGFTELNSTTSKSVCNFIKYMEQRIVFHKTIGELF